MAEHQWTHGDEREDFERAGDAWDRFLHRPVPHPLGWCYPCVAIIKAVIDQSFGGPCTSAERMDATLAEFFSEHADMEPPSPAVTTGMAYIIGPEGMVPATNQAVPVCWRHAMGIFVIRRSALQGVTEQEVLSLGAGVPRIGGAR